MDRLARQICDKQCRMGVNASFMPCCGCTSFKHAISQQYTCSCCSYTDEQYNMHLYYSATRSPSSSPTRRDMKSCYQCLSVWLSHISKTMWLWFRPPLTTMQYVTYFLFCGWHHVFTQQGKYRYKLKSPRRSVLFTVTCQAVLLNCAPWAEVCYPRDRWTDRQPCLMLASPWACCTQS